MKSLKMMAFILLYVGTSSNASLASTKEETKSKTTLAKPSHKKNSGLDAKLGTSFKFDGSSLRGKYQSSMGTAVAVENDKYLDDLLSGRKHFEDRLQEDNNRN